MNLFRILALAVALLAAPVARAAPLAVDVVVLDRVPGPADAARSVRRPGMLPDGVVVRGTGNIRAAWLTGPTARYGHGVLGDVIEASGLVVETRDGRIVSLALDRDAVFEDRYPRPADLGLLLVVKSYLTRGAALAIAGLHDGRLAIIAESEPIGMPNRWLNPVGAGDFDGDGRIETAHIETPHIGGVLVLSRRVRDRLVTLSRIEGFSNHRMGSRELGLSAVLDADGDGVPDLLVPDVSRTRLRIVTFAGGRFRELARIPFRAEIVSVKADQGVNRQPPVILRLSDGRTLGLAFSRRKSR